MTMPSPASPPLFLLLQNEIRKFRSLFNTSARDTETLSSLVGTDVNYHFTKYCQERGSSCVECDLLSLLSSVNFVGCKRTDSMIHHH